MKRICLFTLLLSLLCSCSVNLEEIPWDSMVDTAIDRVVDYLLEGESTNGAGSSGSSGNVAPVSPSNNYSDYNFVPSSVPYYYNKANPHSNFLFLGMTVQENGNGWEVSGAVIGEKSLDEGNFQLAQSLSAEESFSLSLYEYLDDGTLRENKVDCFVNLPWDANRSFHFVNSQGETQTLVVDEWGVLRYEDGSAYYEATDFIHLYIENNTRLKPADGSEDYPDITQIPEGRFLVEVTVISEVCTSFQWR